MPARNVLADGGRGLSAACETPEKPFQSGKNGPKGPVSHSDPPDERVSRLRTSLARLRTSLVRLRQSLVHLR
jgi:hypothetical protein